MSVNGITLQYVDYGGHGETLLLLAGLGNTARVFDEFAPRFTDRFHVVALTRRGFGKSEWPKSGYDLATRVEDIRAFLDALKIDKVNLMGHSIAGDEMTLFATLCPDRVNKLVYLDAIIRFPRAQAEASLLDPSVAGNTSDKAMVGKYMLLDALGKLDSSVAVPKGLPPPDEEAKQVGFMRAQMDFRPEFEKVQAPALAFFTVSANIHCPTAFLTNGADEAGRAKDEAWWQRMGHPETLAIEDQFRRGMLHKEIVIFDDASHYVFKGKTEEAVVCMTRAFLAL